MVVDADAVVIADDFVAIQAIKFGQNRVSNSCDIVVSVIIVVDVLVLVLVLVAAVDPRNLPLKFG